MAKRSHSRQRRRDKKRFANLNRKLQRTRPRPDND